MKQRETRLSFRAGFLLSGVLILLLLSSCLSVEAEFDLSRTERMDLTLRYRMSRTLWELGVFDDTSPERAIPVSRRDAEETALRYPDVTLQMHRIEQEEEIVTVTVQYRAGSADSLQHLWGASGGGLLILREDSRGVSIPLAPQAPGVDQDQRDLLEHLLANQYARVTVLAPRDIRGSATMGLGQSREEETQGNRYSLSVPLVDLVTSPQPAEITLEW